MKKAMKKFKQTLSILLAVAMVITMIPAAPVSAAELNTVEQETTVESEETTDVTSTEETDTPAETEQEVTSTEEEKAEEIEETETIIMEGDAAEDAAETFAVTIGLTVTLDADNNQVTVTADTTTAADPYTFTVEPKSGFQVDDVKAFETATPANVITVDDSKAATDNTYSIADATADFTIQVTSSAVAAVTTYNVTVTKDANVTDVQYALNGAAPYTAYTDAVEVTENDTITLKVTVDANYVPTVKNGSTDVNVTADGNNVYTTDAVTVTDNTTLDITTALVQYAVTVDNQDTTNVTKVEYTTDATNYTDYTAAVDVDYGTDITLRLTANEGFQPVVKNGQQLLP